MLLEFSIDVSSSILIDAMMKAGYGNLALQAGQE